jgi:hypothetical protein
LVGLAFGHFMCFLERANLSYAARITRCVANSAVSDTRLAYEAFMLAFFLYFRSLLSRYELVQRHRMERFAENKQQTSQQQWNQ